MDRFALRIRQQALTPLLLLLLLLLGGLTPSAFANTGSLSGTVTNPTGPLDCTPYGDCGIGVEIFAWDQVTGDYNAYPLTGVPVAPDGTYSLELPLGQYRVVAMDFGQKGLYFAPAQQEILLSVEQSLAVADFTATQLGVSGQITLPAGFHSTDSYGNPLLLVEVFGWDSLAGRYSDYPMTGVPVAADGSYSLELPEGSYKLVPIDITGVLHFAPPEQEIIIAVTAGPVVADFTAAQLGVSGQITLPTGFTTTDSFGNPLLLIEVYGWDSLAGRYSDYPINGTPVAADGSYSLELPEGSYKLLPIDITGVLHFAPAEQEVQISVQNGLVVADFTAAQLGVSGQITLPADFPTTDSYGNPLLLIEVYGWDSLAGRYSDYPINGTPVAADGSYSLELPEGSYKLVPIDITGVLHFAPAEQEVQISVQNGLVIADFTAAQLGVSGQITLPAGFPTTDGYGNPTLWVDIYSWDMVTERYDDYPSNGALVAADGSYELALPANKYKLMPVDPTGALHFAPVSQEVLVSIQSGPAMANFSASLMGISGLVTLPGDGIPCDPYLGCNIGVEVYAWDSISGRYSDYPVAGGPVMPDGSYRFELPAGQYKVVAVDYRSELLFTPSMQEVQLTTANGAAVVNFTATPMGISGQISGQPPCDPYAGCSIGVEVYPWDSATGRFADYPAIGGPVLPDGSFQFDLPAGRYQVVAVDFASLLYFSPAKQEVELTAVNGSAMVNFTAAPMGIVGQITPPAGQSLCSPTNGCTTGVEIYAWDELQGRYGTYPVAGGPTLADGSYRFELPAGRYQAAAVDYASGLYFTPAMRELQITPDNGLATADFAAHAPGISGQLTLDPRDAASVAFCDLNGACRFAVELYARDPATGQYGISPVAAQPVGADGRYAINAPFGDYKVVMVDAWQELAFAPAAQTGLILGPNQGTAIADFTAARPRLSGQMQVDTSDPGFTFCTSAIDCRLVIEAFAYDAVSGDYGQKAVAVASVGIDGRYEIALPQGRYRLKAVDTLGWLEFSPAQIDGVLLDGSQLEVTGLNFQAVEPVPSLSVLAIDLSVNTGKRGWNAVAVVTVVDPDGNLLPGAEVRGVWSGLVEGETVAVTSDRRKALGEASFKSPRTQANGSIGFRVTEIIHPQYPYDARLNVLSEGTVSY